MPAPQDRKFVVADRRVNRRTTLRPVAAPRPAPVSPVSRDRLQAGQARRRLGVPLAEQVRRPDEKRVPWRAPAVAGGMLAAGGAVALMLGALQGAWWLAGGGIAGTLAGLATTWHFRPAPQPFERMDIASSLLEPDAITAFDRAVGEVGPELPLPIAVQLAALKGAVAAIARNPAAARTDEYFTFEDRMYVVECVRRYVPDSLQGFLAVPKAQRAVAVADGQTP
ncbi:MAG TPA: hypothetical protein VIL30_14205, partial [Ramlibacter sp.]